MIIIDWMNLIEQIPEQCGVYLFRNRNKEPIYIGKALSLRSRIRSYLSNIDSLERKTQIMLQQAVDLDYILTDTELEALILESNLIKQYRPKYNIRIKDDKRYPWLKFTYGEDYPRLYIVRLPRRDNHKYYGPYPKSDALRKTLKLIHSIFLIRICKLDIEEGKKVMERPCLEYDLKRCNAPCVCGISKKEYRKICDQICLFLEGRWDDIIRELNKKMNHLAQDMKFEEAGFVRDQIQAVREIQSRQNIYTPDLAERDILGLQSAGDMAVIAVFLIRNGKLIGKEKYRLDGTEDIPKSEIIANFIKQHYIQPQLIPREILASIEPEDKTDLLNWLSGLKNQKVEFRIPKRGKKRQLLEMVEQNAQLHFQEELIRGNPKLGLMQIPTESQHYQNLIELQKLLKLINIPMRIEAYDISNIQGNDAVGSMVVFKNGIPSKSDYRKFKIKSIDGIDDYAMIREIITRRMKYLFQPNNNKNSRGMDELPDLILIDGGLGQLNSALNAIQDIAKGEKTSFQVIGLAKRLDEIYLPHYPHPLLLPYDNKALQLLQLIRDEAHRFAISYHRKLRNKIITKSILDELPHIGKKRKLLLLHHFKTINELKNAKYEELEKIPGLGKKIADKIYQYLHSLK